jgi:hypothetical protein
MPVSGEEPSSVLDDDGPAHKTLVLAREGGGADRFRNLRRMSRPSFYIVIKKTTKMIKITMKRQNAKPKDMNKFVI